MPSKDISLDHRMRLQGKFIKLGLTDFNDYGNIELLLTLGSPCKDCKQLARRAIKKFKTLRRVLEAHPEELQRIYSIGPHSAFVSN